jgi:hypothetical protein
MEHWLPRAVFAFNPIVRFCDAVQRPPVRSAFRRCASPRKRDVGHAPLADMQRPRRLVPEPDDGTKRTSRAALLMSDHHTSILSIILPFFEQD